MTGVALVTGASRGIGREVARELHRRGHVVIATGRDAAALDALREEIGDTGFETAVIDLDAADVADQVKAALAGRPLGLLVLNAATFAPWDETAAGADLVAARKVVETNLFGTWAVLQAALPSLREADGATVIGVGSGSGSHGDPQFGLAVNPGAASYAVSKAAVHALLHRLAGELAGDRISVYTVDPGLTATSPGMAEFGARPVRDGALSVLAPLSGSLESGSFTRDGAPLPW